MPSRIRGFWATLARALLAATGACTEDGAPASNIADPAVQGDAGNDSSAIYAPLTQPAYQPCSLSLDALCAMPSAGCVGDWTTALRTALTSYGRACQYAPPWSVQVEVCGRFDVLAFFGTDTGTAQYYDGASGALVAVVNVGANLGGAQACVAGPADFVPPSSCSSMSLCDLVPDGGADAETGGFDAADSASE